MPQNVNERLELPIVKAGARLTQAVLTANILLHNAIPFFFDREFLAPPCCLDHMANYNSLEAGADFLVLVLYHYTLPTNQRKRQVH